MLSSFIAWEHSHGTFLTVNVRFDKPPATLAHLCMVVWSIEWRLGTDDIFCFSQFFQSWETVLCCLATGMSHCECFVHFNTDECTFFLLSLFNGLSVGGVLPGGKRHHGPVDQSVVDFSSLRLPGEEMFLVTHIATTAGNTKWTWTYTPPQATFNKAQPLKGCPVPAVKGDGRLW